MLSVPIVASRNFLVYANVTYFVCSTIVTMDHTTFLHVLKYLNIVFIMWKRRRQVHGHMRFAVNSAPLRIKNVTFIYGNVLLITVYLISLSTYIVILYFLCNGFRIIIPIDIIVSYNLLFILVGTA